MPIPITAFSTNVLLLSSKSNRLCPPSLSKRPAEHVRCTAAPQRAKFSKTSKKSLPTEPQYYRVLPDNLSSTERPPLPPRHNSVPYVGFFLEYFLGKLEGGLKVLNGKYGPIYFSSFFLGPMFYLGSYGAMCEILKDDVTFVTGDAFPGVDALFGKDAFSQLDGRDHMVVRSVLAPAFSPALFPYYLKNVVSRTKKTWESVEESVKKDGSALFDPVFRGHYLAITIEMTTGVEVNSARSSLMCSLFADFVESFTMPKFMPAHKRGLEARDNIRNILREVIIENLSRRREMIENLREYGDDVVKLGMKDISSGNVDVLLVSIANSSLSTDGKVTLDEELVGVLSRNMMLLWFAGYITSAITSACGVFELGYRSDLLARLVKEQDDIVGAVEDGEVTYDQVHSQMPLLDAYLMEILRLFPAASSVQRKTTCDVEILGRYVPKGSRVLIDIPGPHNDESIYANAGQLIPERWLQRPKPPAILSFGAPGSAHYCIGAAFAKMMMKVTFATLLREYTFSLDPAQSRKYRMLPDNAPESGVVVSRFQRR